MSQRYDLVRASQTRYARGLRRDLESVDRWITFERPARLPERRAPGLLFQALAHAERWLWDSGGARLSKRLAIGAAAAIASVIAFHLFH